MTNMLSKRIIFAAITLAGATLLPVGTAFGSPSPPLIILTENSSTSLTASAPHTAIQFSIQNTSADQWTITLLNANADGTSGSGSWTEPDSSTEGNLVQLSGDTMTVISDDAGQAGLADGTIDTTGFTLHGQELDVQFTDNGGESVSVPDDTSTLPLLSLALASLGVFAKRKMA